MADQLLSRAQDLFEGQIVRSTNYQTLFSTNVPLRTLKAKSSPSCSLPLSSLALA